MVITLLKIMFVVVFVTGCAPVDQLVHSKSFHSEPASIQREGIAVSYDLLFSESKNFSGYKLTLVLRNDTNQTQEFSPGIVLLRDASGLIIAPDTYQSLVSQAATLAGASVPPAPVVKEVGHDYSYSGTVISQGSTSQYSGQITSETARRGSASSFFDGYAQGSALRATMDATKDRKEGQSMLQWANNSWLREKYVVPSKSAVSGVLFFPSQSISGLPLSLLVRINNKEFEFKPISQ